MESDWQSKIVAEFGGLDLSVPADSSGEGDSIAPLPSPLRENPIKAEPKVEKAPVPIESVKEHDKISELLIENSSVSEEEVAVAAVHGEIIQGIPIADDEVLNLNDVVTAIPVHVVSDPPLPLEETVMGEIIDETVMNKTSGETIDAEKKTETETETKTDEAKMLAGVLDGVTIPEDADPEVLKELQDAINASKAHELNEARIAAGQSPLPPDSSLGAKIPNVINSCYMDSVLMAMFLPKLMDVHLCKDMKHNIGTYLQSIIKTEIVDRIRDNMPVSEYVMRGLRQQMIEVGWKSFAEEYDQQDAKEMYAFLIEHLEFPLIEIRRKTFTNGVAEKSDTGGIEKLSYISVSLPPDSTDEPVNVNDMIHNWFHNNMVRVKRKKSHQAKTVDDVEGLNTYTMVNTPPLIGIAINRFPDHTIRNNTPVIPQRVILPFKHERGDICRLSWQLQALICHRPAPLPEPIPEGYSPLKSGHYYSVIVLEDNYYLFDDLKTPSLIKIERNRKGGISDKELTKKLKNDLVFVLYREYLPT